MLLFTAITLLLSLQKSLVISLAPPQPTFAVLPSADILDIGYSPFYDLETNSVYFADQYSEDAKVCRYDNGCSKTVCATVIGQSYASAIVPVDGCKNQFVIGLRTSLVIAEWDGESKNVYVTKTVFSNPKSTSRIDTVKTDPTGRVYFGEYGTRIVGAEPNSTLFSYTPTEGLRQVYSGYKSCFGIAFCSKTGKAFFSDAAGYTIYQFDWCKETGQLSNRVVLYTFDVVPGDKSFFAFGLTIDSSGNLYVGSYGGSEVMKINRTGSTKCPVSSLEKIKLPFAFVGCPEFGGKNLDELYVTLSSLNIDLMTGESCPKKCEETNAGSLLRIKNIGWQGVASTRARLSTLVMNDHLKFA